MWEKGVMDTSLVISAAIFGLVTSVTPGPNNTYLLASGMNYGIRRSMPYLFGILTGLAVVVSAIILGLGLVFTTFPAVYQILKWVGFGYICWMAYGVATSGTKTAQARSSSQVGYWKALIFQFVNPKAWIVSASFVATYVPAGRSIWIEIIFAAILVLTTMPGALVWATMGQLLSAWLSDVRKRTIFNYVAAVLLVLSMVPVLFL
jgi:threonine/homoserine/homoserine lactone efflux protein